VADDSCRRSGLDDDHRKVVALYLLLAFEKIAERDGGINALLVLDEGEELLPRRRGGRATPTTIQRLTGRVAGIARRGRRRRFGMMVCRQTPSDVDQVIVANCDVKLTFNAPTSRSSRRTFTLVRARLMRTTRATSIHSGFLESRLVLSRHLSTPMDLGHMLSNAAVVRTAPTPTTADGPVTTCASAKSTCA
jgi:DNA helicase HerA-like ATPase